MSQHQVRDVLGDLRSPTLISVLDLSRWVAAAIVFVAHLRDPLFLGYGDVPTADRTIGVQLWYFVTGWHAEAVTVFFVLSGLLVGGAGCARAKAGQFPPWNYAVDRFTRLYLPFIPALLLGYFMDLIGSNALQSVGFWNRTQPMVAQKISSPPFDTLVGSNTLVGNIAMLQDYLVAPLGSNQPLWTISAEFWFYVVFGVAVTCLYSARSAGTRIGALLALAGIFALLGPYFLVLLGLWSIGVAIAFVPRTRLQSARVALVIFLAVLIVARLETPLLHANATLREIKNFAVALSFAWLVVCMRGKKVAFLERLSRPNAFMASFSYSLYLLHFPLMLFLLGLLHATGRFPGIAHGYRPKDLTGILVYLSTIVTVYVLAWLFSLFTERRTARARQFLKKRVPLFAT